MFVYINSFNRKHITSASSLAASRNAHEGIVEEPNVLNIPRARRALRHSNFKAGFLLLDLVSEQIWVGIANELGDVEKEEVI